MLLKRGVHGSTEAMQLAFYEIKHMLLTSALLSCRSRWHCIIGQSHITQGPLRWRSGCPTGG